MYSDIRETLLSARPLRQCIIGVDRVSAPGLGCSNLSFQQDTAINRTSLEVLTTAADLGTNFWDTSDAIRQGENEMLIGKWFKDSGRREEIFICTKFGNLEQSGEWTVRGDAAYVKEACAASLKRLGIDVIDLYYQHRVDPATPIEETVKAMAELERAGKIRYLGLSKCSAQTLRRAHAVHQISAVQIEYSPFAMEIESEQTQLLATARELGVVVVSYSPLGRGLAANLIRSRDDFHPNEYRLNHPRFSEEHFGKNLQLKVALLRVAQEKKISLSQLILAWLMVQGDDIIPLPATRQIVHVQENWASKDVMLSSADKRKIRQLVEDAIADFGGIKGSRLPQTILERCFADTPLLS